MILIQIVVLLVLVLFLFIIMLMDIRAEERRQLNLLAFGGGIAVTLGFVVQLATVLSKFTPGSAKLTPLKNEGSDVKLVGYELFTNYNFHLQVIGVLLLVSTIGVVVLSRRATK